MALPSRRRNFHGTVTAGKQPGRPQSAGSGEPVILLRLGQILDVVEMQGKAGIMAKLEIELQKELK